MPNHDCVETKHFAVFDAVLLFALTVDKTGILPKMTRMDALKP